MSESVAQLLKEIAHGSDVMGTYHRRYTEGPQGPLFAGLVAQSSSGTEYTTTNPAVSEQFFKTVDYSGDAVTGLGSPENGEHGYESCGHWHTFQNKGK